jgi:crotonobetainyl-CoA:carnitine CoA-transferase CaiB-like acyl-CoA transferase
MKGRDMGYEAPFRGLRVVDASQGIAGPYAAMLLGLYGADVVKIEPPEGDWARHLGRRYGDQSAFSIAGNLGKRSIAADLKTDEGREIVRRLARDADVFIEGFRPGVAARLGIGYDDIARLSPRVIYLSVSGFGQTGPDRERPAMDPIVQSFTGLVWTNRGLDGIPHRVVPIVIDMATALYSFQALAVALYARRDEPRGCRLEASLMQAAAGLQTVHMMAFYLEGGTMQQGLVPGGSFKVADGWMYVLIHRNEDFSTLCAALDIPEVARDPRFSTNDARRKHLADLNPRLVAAFAPRTGADIAARLRAAGIMHQVVQDYVEFLKHPQIEATGAIAWLEQPSAGTVPIPNVPGVPALASGTRRATAPALDEHRAEILREIGLHANGGAGAPR